MLAAICVTILATSALKCEVGPEARVSQTFTRMWPGQVIPKQVLVFDSDDGEMKDATLPFIVRETDPQWRQVLLVAKMSANLRLAPQP